MLNSKSYIVTIQISINSLPLPTYNENTNKKIGIVYCRYGIKAVILAPNGNHMAVQTNTHEIRIAEIESGQSVNSFPNRAFTSKL